jgi:hypothetical protein
MVFDIPQAYNNVIRLFLDGIHAILLKEFDVLLEI